MSFFSETDNYVFFLGGAQKKFWGARNVYSSMDQTKKVKTKKRKKGLRPKISTNSGCRLKILAIFDEI